MILTMVEKKPDGGVPVDAVVDALAVASEEQSVSDELHEEPGVLSR
jgi:hypothetical protein